MINLPSTPATRVGLNVLILLGSVVALRLGESVLIPLIIALLLAAVLGPAALWLHRRLHFSWTGSCLFAIFGLVVLNLLISVVFVISVSRMVNSLPAPQAPAGKTQQVIYEGMVNKIRALVPWWEFGEDVFPQNAEDSPVFSYIRDTVQKSVPDALKNIAMYVCIWGWQCILVLFILFFLLLEGGMLIRRGVEIFGPSQEVQDKARAVLSDMAGQVKTYLVWRTIINFGLALVVGAVYQVAGLHQPWTWAMLLAVLNYVPYLGPVLAGIPPLFDALLSISPLGTVVVVGAYAVVIVLEGYLVVPVLMGRNMDLNATTVLLACLFWELVWGTLGLFLAMPLMAALKAICFHVPGWRPWANLMSTAGDERKPVMLQAALRGSPTTDAIPEKEPMAAPEKEPMDTAKSRVGSVLLAVAVIAGATLSWLLVVLSRL
jgi:predicted PurR-regulated permease PerM